MDERVWLRHAATGGAFHCPVDAVPAWQELGWVEGEPPPEYNPVVAEMLAAQQAAAVQEPAPKTSRTRGADTTTGALG